MAQVHFEVTRSGPGDDGVNLWVGNAEAYQAWLNADSEADPPKPEPDVFISRDQMNELFVQWMRGPMGPPGAMGPMGAPGESAK